MPVPWPLHQDVCQKMREITRQAKIRKTTITRLALLAIGIIATKSCVPARVADELFNLALTKASDPDSIVRRIGRILSDKNIDAKTCYEPVLFQVIDWGRMLKGNNWVVLIIDESSKNDKVHLFRVSLAYRGGALPLAWIVWEQNQALPEGTYWTKVRAVLDRVAALLPPGLNVLMTADRAYDNPAVVDEIEARGWHWDIRLKAKSSVRFRDRRGREHELSKLIKRNVRAPGMRWKARGWVFKDAGWREASVIAVWARGEDEPLVIITDLPCKWEMVNWYGRRFWTEPGFRNDKKMGWQWEDCQVTKLEHHERLLVAMAWATLVMLCIGAEEAKARIERQVERAKRRTSDKKRPAKPEHARQSVFTMGLRRASAWFYRTTDRILHWRLPEVDGLSWNQSWYQHQANLYITKTVLP